MKPIESKAKTDIAIHNYERKTSDLTPGDEENIKFLSIQNLNPKFKFEKSNSSHFNESFSETTQSPENLSESENENDFSQILFTIERMKSESSQLKPQPLSDKGDPLFHSKQKFEGKVKINPFRSLIFNPNCRKDLFYRHLEKVHESLVYGVHHLNKPSVCCLHTNYISLGEMKKKNQKTLFLDLDETLIRSCHINENPKYIIEGDLFEGERAFGFNVRPFCLDFLKIISKYYEVFVFTASSDLYANLIIDILDLHKKYIRGILFRNHCRQTKKGIFIKDLRIVQNREMKNMVIVDNNAHAFALQLENGIPILEWKGDENDRELKYLLHYLMEMATTEDVRDFNRKFLKLEELSNLDDVQILNIL